MAGNVLSDVLLLSARFKGCIIGPHSRYEESAKMQTRGRDEPNMLECWEPDRMRGEKVQVLRLFPLSILRPYVRAGQESNSHQ